MAKKPTITTEWKVLQPFTFQDGDTLVRCHRGEPVPLEVLEQDALRLRLLRTKMIFDPEHPESFGAQQSPPSRMERLQRDTQAPLRPAEQDEPVAPDVLAERRRQGDERMLALNAKLNRPTFWTPTKADDPRAGSGYPTAILGGG